MRERIVVESWSISEPPELAVRCRVTLGELSSSRWSW
jgi:hypothetical protein